MGSPREMIGCNWSCLIVCCSLGIGRVTPTADFLRSASLFGFDNLPLNSNSLHFLANLEAADVCQDAEDYQQCYQNFMELKRLMRQLMMNKRLFIQKRPITNRRLFIHKRGNEKNKVEERIKRQSNHQYNKRKLFQLLKQNYNISKHVPFFTNNLQTNSNTDQMINYLPFVGNDEKHAVERESKTMEQNLNEFLALPEYGLDIDQIKDEPEEKQDLQDLKVMYNNMEKSLQLLSKSAVKMVPIPRIG